jgi:hypothetical protein
MVKAEGNAIGTSGSDTQIGRGNANCTAGIASGSCNTQITSYVTFLCYVGLKLSQHVTALKLSDLKLK